MSVILFGIAPSLVVSFDSSLTPNFFYQTITILPERLKGNFFGRSQHKCLIKKHLKEERKSTWNWTQRIKFLTTWKMNVIYVVSIWLVSIYRLAVLMDSCAMRVNQYNLKCLLVVVTVLIVEWCARWSCTSYILEFSPAAAASLIGWIRKIRKPNSSENGSGLQG